MEKVDGRLIYTKSYTGGENDGIFEIIVDGSTAYTVNHIDKIPGEVNLILRMLF